MVGGFVEEDVDYGEQDIGCSTISIPDSDE